MYIIIVINIRNNTKKQIDEECKDLFKSKLKIMNIISERTIKEDREFELIDEHSDMLRDLNTYFPKLVNYLWEEPKIVALVLKHSDTKELKDDLAPFFANNFYENILSTYYIEDNLMYLLTLLLKDEINQLNNINDSESFLKESACGFLLEELRKKSDIQAFFKNIIFNDVENLEINYSSLKFGFKVSRLRDDYIIQRRKEPKSKKKAKKDEGYIKYMRDSVDNSNNNLEESNSIYRNKKQIQEDLENFNRKYVPDLDKSSLKSLINDYKDNKNMYDYLSQKIDDCKIKDIYSNQLLLDNLYKCQFSKELLFQYQYYFNIIIKFIDSILDKILNNIHLLPYSVRCLCKIISKLITKKFPTINENEKNSFIAKFFFDKLLIPILKNPGLEAFINNFIISENTVKNLTKISSIIKKFASGTFFAANEETSDYTPFNWFFIEKMENLFKIFDHITKANLPSFIEKCINNDLPEDYQYDYFKENPDEVINYRSIFFNLNQIKVLASTMNKYKDKIFTNPKHNGLKKTVEKIVSQTNLQLLNNLIQSEKKKPMPELSPPKTSKREKEKEELAIGKDKPKVHYFLITSILANEKYQKLFKLEQPEANFSIKELKNITNEEEMTKNNIIKVKNFFCSLLYNYNKLVKTDFDEGTTETTEKILKELNIFMKSSNFVVDGSIPSEWYVKSLLEYLQKIPEELTKNDCTKLYDEIENDVNKSIKELDFEALSVIIGKLRYAKRGKSYYEEIKKLLNDIKLNEETKSIIENEFIPVEIKFMLVDEKEDNNEFQINPSNFKEKDKDNKEKIKDLEISKKKRICITIDDFTKKFPNLVKYQELQDADIFEIQKNLDFPTQINNYLNLVNSALEKKKVVDLKLINNKIYDYVMTKIYDKIYPIEPYEIDNKIFQQSIRLSWTLPDHFIKSKRKLIFGSFLSDVIKYFKLIDIEKSPRKKMVNVTEIFNSIGFLLKFNGAGNDTGVDDQLPILNYAFVKAQPLRMHSNVRLMELYIGDKKNKIEGSQLTQLSSICDYISDIKYTDLNDVDSEEYIKKCNEATAKEFIKA